MDNLPYIECAGVDVPANWTVNELREALAKRHIRFRQESDIIAMFGNALKVKAELTQEVSRLRTELGKLTERVRLLKGKLICPKCAHIYDVGETA